MSEFIKLNGNWVSIYGVYQKINNAWVLQNDSLQNILSSSNNIYVYNNNGVITEVITDEQGNITTRTTETINNQDGTILVIVNEVTENVNGTSSETNSTITEYKFFASRDSSVK